jgi:hypothetical protein
MGPHSPTMWDTKDAAPALAATAGSSPPLSRRADAGSVRLGGRDVAGLLLCGDMYGVPYDLLAVARSCGRTGFAASWPGGGTPGMRRPRGWVRGQRGAG